MPSKDRDAGWGRSDRSSPSANADSKPCKYGHGAEKRYRDKDGRLLCKECRKRYRRGPASPESMQAKPTVELVPTLGVESWTSLSYDAREKEASKANESTAPKAKRTTLDRVESLSPQEALEQCTTDKDKVLWFARQGVEIRDIILQLGWSKRIVDVDFKIQVDQWYELGISDMRVELARTIKAEASMGQVSALKAAAQAHLLAYKEREGDEEFASSFRIRFEELVAKIYDDQHEHVRRKLVFTEEKLCQNANPKTST